MDLPLKNEFRLDNRVLGSISSIELIKRKNDIIIPYSQRLGDSNKVQEILEYQKGYKLKNDGKYNFLGVINLHFCLQNMKYYLVDGQHRFEAISSLVSELEDFDIVIEVVEIEKTEDLIENYNLINKNTPLPELNENINKLAHQMVFQYFEDKFNKKVWKSSNNPRRPYLKKNHFQEAISYLMDKLKIDDHNKIIKLIDEHNKRVSKWDLNRIGNMKNLKDPEKTLELCEDLECYLGLFPHTTDEYHYRWINDIIRIETGVETKSKVKKIKKTIPKQLKKEIWNRFIGEDKGNYNCLVCNNIKISQMGFVVGHIVAESLGGSNTIDNLRPICKECNASMATMNMEEYVKEYYPTNYFRLKLGCEINSNYQKKEYSSSIKKISL